MYDDIDMKNKRTIAETAQETGLTTDTLRYYERIGLITDIERADNTHRLYCEADITWILFLKQLRATGMPIAQMKQFAELRRGGDNTVTPRREMLEQHRADLERQIQLIREFMSVIDFKIARHKQTEAQMIGDIDHEHDTTQLD